MSTGPLLAVELDRSLPPGAQIEQQLRRLIGSGSLPIGIALPSTRTLAADLEVSRGVAVRAYGQLAAEGYIRVRRGAPPLVVATPREPVSWEAVEEDVAGSDAACPDRCCGGGQSLTSTPKRCRYSSGPGLRRPGAADGIPS